MLSTHAIFSRFSWKHVLCLASILVALHLLLNNGGLAKQAFATISTGTPTVGSPESQTSKIDIAIEDTIPTGEEYFALCVASKDQASELPEFLRHHYHHMNVTRFYIMDDRSDPPLSSFKYPGIPRSALTFNHYTQDDAGKVGLGLMQWWIYQECINLYKDNHTWMGFIDADEFFEVRTNETMEGILRELGKNNHIGSLSANWRMHTSSGHIEPPESVREGFVSCIQTNYTVDDMSQDERHVKSIVRTDKFDGLHSAHMFKLKDGAIAVGEDGKVVSPGTAWRFPITRNRVVLHHYAIKSRREFQEKMDRWKGDIPKGWWFWDHLEGFPQVDCPEMARYTEL
jgi:hypothetical protein